MKQKTLTTDLLIIGGGTAGCYAAITAARQAPDLRILVVEKANIKRSGCLAAGVNAINAYITQGQTTQDYLEFVRWDAEGIIRDDLVLSMAEEFNEATADLETMGLVIQKDAQGNYVSRGKQNIKINGENIKPILARQVRKFENVTVLNHVNITDYLTQDGRVCGAVGFSCQSADRLCDCPPGPPLRHRRGGGPVPAQQPRVFPPQDVVSSLQHRRGLRHGHPGRGGDDQL